MKANIVWKDQTGPGRSGWDGYAGGKLSLVTVSYTSQRTGPKWIVHTRLPIAVPDRLAGSDDSDVAKEMAEKLITAFLSTIGARWT